MSTIRSWVDVVQQVQRSGLDIQRQKLIKDHERLMFVQKQLENQINLSQNKKIQQRQRKSIQRINAEAIDRNNFQKQRTAKKQYRQKQQKFRIHNLSLLKHRNESLTKLFEQQKDYKNMQNPITANLYDSSDSRKRKIRQQSVLCGDINQRLINDRLKINKQTKQINNQQGRKFQEYVQTTFKNIDEQRTKFQKFCLSAGNPSSNRLTTEPDTLQREYSFYLQQQINEKKSRNNINIFRKDDGIFDNNLLKLNQNSQIQSASPAYLGRIPYNYDRQKQLSYLNKQSNKHQRTKTQVSEYSKPTIKINKQVFSQAKQQKSINNPQFFNNKRDQIQHKKQDRKFRQYNIITNNMANMQIPLYYF